MQIGEFSGDHLVMIVDATLKLVKCIEYKISSVSPATISSLFTVQEIKS